MILELLLGAHTPVRDQWFIDHMVHSFAANCSTRVANELGADRAHAAKFAVYLALGLAITEASIVAVFFVLVRSVWGRLFSSEKEVVQYVSDLMPFLAVTTAADSVQGVLSG